MVVASGGWVQNASCPASQTNSNLNSAQTNEMTAKGILICRDNSHPFQERTLSLEQAVKIGRSVARARAAPNNAIFDCKVLSRNHALLWYSGGKFYLQDNGSSNGTFVNNQRLSASGVESLPKEVCSGDIVQFGVDVIENTRKVTHGCIVATLKLYLPDGKEAKASLSTAVTSIAGTVSLEDLYKLNQVMEDAWRREKGLFAKLTYLKQLVENTRTAASKSWQALIAEDRLLSWVDALENQLAVFSKKYPDDKIRYALVKLHEEKAQYQIAAKAALERILQEKLKATQRVAQLESRLKNREVECLSLHNEVKFAQTELEDMCRKYTQAQEQLQETIKKLMETEEKMKDILQNTDQEKQDLLKKLEDQAKIEKNLRARLRDSRVVSATICKQIITLRNYMQTLQDMIPKMVSSELLDTKDEENPIEAINTILNKLNSILYTDNSDADMETNFYSSKAEQDNQINSQDIDSNQLSSANLPCIKDTMENSLVSNDNLTEYILPPPSRRTLVNGNGNVGISDSNVESDTISDATDDTCSITSDDATEKSVVESRKEGDMLEVIAVPHKMEVRFAHEESGEQLEVHYPPMEPDPTENAVVDVCEESVNKSTAPSESSTILSDKYEEKEEPQKEESHTVQECEDEHLEGEYVKTLKPLSKSDSTQQCTQGREYILQSLIGSLESLTSEDDLESLYTVKKELEELKDWLVCESHDIIIDRLKELYYKAKNETQRIQEVHEELVILKEKYNAFAEEKAELSRKYTTLKAQSGDLLNATYTVPIHYVAPIALMLVWMLLEKMF